MDEFARRAGADQAARTLADRIRRRLLAGFLLFSLVAAGTMVAGLVAYLGTDRAYSDVLTETSFIQSHATGLNDAIVSEVLHTRAYLITGDEQSITSRELAHRDFEDEYASLQTMLDHLSAEAQLALQKLATLHATYDALAEEIIALRRSGQAAAAVELFNERSDPLVLVLLSAKRELQIDVRTAMIRANREFSAHTGRIIFLVAVIFLIGAIVSGWFVARLLAAPLLGLEYFERALVETVQSKAMRPLRLPLSGSERHSPMYEAYNSLVTHLEDSETSRLDFLSTIAHELRSQLASILGYSVLLRDSATKDSQTARDQYARMVVTQSENMARAIDDMITAAAIDEDRLDIVLSPLRVGPLLAEVIDEKQRGSRRTIEFEENLGPTPIMGDVLRLREVFSRLIDNALKFSPADTPVRVTSRLAATPGWAEIAVIDRGIGIAEADMPLLFRRFGRIRNERTRGTSGVGLGLYIVKYLVERHRGHIAVHSQPGQGTTCIVTLPVMEAVREGTFPMAERAVR